MLKMDLENRQFFISRGGKRRYFLSNRFVSSFIKESTVKDEHNNVYLQEIKVILLELKNNNKLGLNTKSKVIALSNLVDELIQ